MDEVIITDCPICRKPVKVIDKKQEAEADDITKCDGNEYYTCYVSKENHEWRYLARRSSKRVINFPDGKNDLNLPYHKKALKL